MTDGTVVREADSSLITIHPSGKGGDKLRIGDSKDVTAKAHELHRVNRGRWRVK